MASTMNWASPAFMDAPGRPRRTTGAQTPGRGARLAVRLGHEVAVLRRQHPGLELGWAARRCWLRWLRLAAPATAGGAAGGPRRRCCAGTGGWWPGGGPIRVGPTGARLAMLIKRLARENPGRGYQGIQGELPGLGYRAGAPAVSRVLKRRAVPPAPRRGQAAWRQFWRAPCRPDAGG